MTDRPILFSGPMVRALLAGTKTQTRRTLNPQPAVYTPRVIDILPPSQDDETGEWGQVVTEWDSAITEPQREIWRPLKTVRYHFGDRLYVREHWRTFVSLDAIAPRDLWVAGGQRGAGLLYLADNGSLSMTSDGVRTFGSREGDIAPFGKHRQAMHMPRWASRLTLTVTDVRVERLQDISDEDAEAEGCPECEECHGASWINSGPNGGWQCTATGCGDAYVDQYARLWNQINGPGSWEANPWVAAYTFTVQRGNIDQVAP